MSAHHFSLRAEWNGGLAGVGKIQVGSLETAISVPKALKGPGTGSNPEELLVGSAATCYLITLAAILEHRKAPVTRLELESVGEVSGEGAGLRFTGIVHRPRVTLAASSSEEDEKNARDAAERAEKACMISNALRGNVTVSVEAKIIRS